MHHRKQVLNAKPHLSNLVYHWFDAGWGRARPWLMHLRYRLLAREWRREPRLGVQFFLVHNFPLLSQN